MYQQQVAGGLMVRVVGAVAVSRAGRVLPVAEVGTRKARTLLALLAVNGGQVPIDRIAPAVWGDAPPREPVANVATLVSRLRATLGPDVIIGDRAGYRLGAQVRVDLFQAAELVEEAEVRLTEEPALAMVTARRADQLLGIGVVLAEHPEAGWAEPARTSHGLLLRRVRHTIAASALQVGELRIAAEAAEAAMAVDPFDEAACRMLMRAHRAAGEPARALLAYRQLSTTLATELGIDPAPATRALHVAILRGATEPATRTGPGRPGGRRAAR